MHDVLHTIINAQTSTFVQASTQCRHCHAEQSMKTANENTWDANESLIAKKLAILMDRLLVNR